MTDLDATTQLNTLPQNVVEYIAFFLTAAETAATASSNTTLKVQLEDSIAFHWEVLVDSKRHSCPDSRH